MAVALVIASVAPAGANLTPSTFAGGDGNLLAGAGESDWANVGLTSANIGVDKPTGQTDDSFGQGTKEDTGVPSVVDGSIPNNKSDLTRFYVFTEKVGGNDYLYVAWERVQEPQGTTNMDFEFNQSSTLSANGVTPIRTAGDVLIKYDLSQGGTHPTLGYHKWVTSGNPAQICEASNSLPCWDKVHSIVDANFEGATNAGTEEDPILVPPQTASRFLSPRTFGEAAVNLTGAGILPAPGSGQCVAFGSTYLKSRSSDAFTAALKDFIAPIGITISNCAALTIVKQSVGGTGSFAFTGSGGNGLDSSFSIATTTTNPNSKLYPALPPGSYTVTETVPAAWELTTLSCVASGAGTSAAQDGTTPAKANITLGTGGSVTCTYTDTKKPTLTVNKVLVPGADSGKFNLQIDGATAGSGADVGDGGTTGAQFVSVGSHTVGETAGTGTALADYATTISGDCAAGGSVTLAAGDAKTCTITNTRLPRITINKVCVPTNDTGKFTLRLDGASQKTDAGCGTGTGVITSTIGAHSVSEIAGTGTDLANYTTTIGGDCAADGSVSLAAGDNKTCTITNTRRLFTVIVLVCDQSNNTLYSSEVSFDGSTKHSLSSAPAGLTDAQLCGLAGGARFTNKTVGTYSASATIHLTEDTATP
jgi:hypothetical protein